MSQTKTSKDTNQDVASQANGSAHDGGSSGLSFEAPYQGITLPPKDETIPLFNRSVAGKPPPVRTSQRKKAEDSNGTVGSVAQKQNGNEEESAESQPQLVMVQEEAPTGEPGEIDWSPIRRAAVTFGNSLHQRALTANSAIEEIAAIAREFRTSGSSYKKVLSESSKNKDEIQNLLGIELDKAMYAVQLIETAENKDMEDVMAAAGPELALADEQIYFILQDVMDYSKQTAHQAADANVMDAAKLIIECGDSAFEAAQLRVPIKVILAEKAARGRRRDKAGTFVDVGDFLNNLAGFSSGIAGVVEAVGVSGASGGAAVGIPASIAGIFFGAIGVAVGLYALITGLIKRSALKKIAPAMTDGELKEALDYAKSQKGKAAARGVAVVLAGGLAITAGILGLIALSVTTFGTAAIVAGIAAAIVGLSFVAYKIIHARSKRKGERMAFAESMVDEIAADGPKASEFKATIKENGLNPDDIAKDRAGFIKSLSDKVGDLVKRQRQKTAESLINFMINGKPSQKFQSELVIKALGINPESIRKKLDKGDYKTAVSRIMGKLSSW